MNNICIYLRKSRADEELEKTLGAGETLSKHRKALLKFAKERDLNIIEIKEEIVSGESLFHRPKMLELLREIEENKYSGVLVMDMQRLGRGNMSDQGIILEAFKKSKTLIITPQKTYNLDNEFDEEYSEFEAFMSRKELKMINRRMQGGRVRSVEDGNYIATNPPLGYDIHFVNRSRTLKINDDEAEIIKTIFNMYCEDNGASAIAQRLNMLGYKTKTGGKFIPSSVLNIIKNPVYIGKITWKKKEIKKSKEAGKVKDTRTRDKSEWIIVDGKHKAIIDIQIWDKSQNILNNKYHIPYQLSNAPVNPLAGLITCQICGKKMTMRKIRGIERLMCVNKCGNKSNVFKDIEEVLIKEMSTYLENYKFKIENEPESNNNDHTEKQLNILEKELSTLSTQRSKLFDFLERGVYSEEVFVERSKELENRTSSIKKEIDTLKLQLEPISKVDKKSITIFENVIELYKKTNDIADKNKLLKKILKKIEYFKEPTAKAGAFDITIFPSTLR